MPDVPSDDPPRTTSGGPSSAEELVALLYDELRQLAAARLRALPAGQTLQPTALVNEAFLRIQARGDKAWQGRRHFFGAAARAMHDILVERARARARLKRGGGQKPVPLDDADPAAGLALPEPDLDVLALSEALARLAQENPRGHEVVMLRYFAGLEHEEIAAMLDSSERTVRREWQFVRAWLKDAMGA
ncbi:MAG: sigma-70 family RNA polymerase sigma factor [Planctomycetes bacterium]|nr:sigma-70 family RNA polymerase sigma factor [Planctomycetota bacterium]